MKSVAHIDNQKIRRLRVAACQSQAELAATAKLSVRSVQNIEQGRQTNVHLSTARRLAEALHVPPSEIATAVLTEEVVA